ncbi:unnamed protein product [Sphagnum troendelagicum]|uniref:Uncharacterized protein n=1 Tax=Sphagnum troendelagicum TaxID=128251 RepID=A0ABP0U153_9BRYO
MRNNRLSLNNLIAAIAGLGGGWTTSTCSCFFVVFLAVMVIMAVGRDFADLVLTVLACMLDGLLGFFDRLLVGLLAGIFLSV